MFEITANGRPVPAEEGETILSALKRAGIRVPALCAMENLTPTGACRICVVELEGGELVPSCSQPVREGMRLFTNSEKVIRARKTILELILAGHPDDCLYCVRSGDCELRKLAAEYGIRSRSAFKCRQSVAKSDISGSCIVLDRAKCILCGKCVRVCDEIQGVSALCFTGRGGNSVVEPAFGKSLNTSDCVNCGLCTTVCPTGALHEKSSLRHVTALLSDPETEAFVQYDASVPPMIADAFGFRLTSSFAGKLNAVLRRAGFRRVLETEPGTGEYLARVSEAFARFLEDPDRKKPFLTVCSRAAEEFIRRTKPEFADRIFRIGTPQSIRSDFVRGLQGKGAAERRRKIASVAITPCTAKKEDAAFGGNGLDAVLTVRELIRLIRLGGSDLSGVAPEPCDFPAENPAPDVRMPCVSGGLCEAVARRLAGGGPSSKGIRFDALRGGASVRQLRVRTGRTEVLFAVADGLGAAGELLSKIAAEECSIPDFLEISACPGGCVAGGGRPHGDSVRDRSRLFLQESAGEGTK